MSHILIVEDEPVIRGAIRKLLERHEHSTVEAPSVEEALEHNLSDFDLVISDLRLPGAQGTELIQQAHPTPVLMMTSYASLRSAVDAMRLGAVDYIAKPFDHDEMITAVSRILEQKTPPRRLSLVSNDPSKTLLPVIGQSENFSDCMTRINKVSNTEVPVLLLGETGSGKEHLARVIHQQSSRAGGQFVSVSCSAIAADQADHTLFGQEKGNDQIQKGLLESAHLGTLFLDDINELSASNQARLLRLIEEQQFPRLGGAESRPADIRLLAASSRNLQRLVEEGRFRADLYHRLNVMQIMLPSLREREQDALQLTDHFLDLIGKRLGIHSPGLTEAAENALLAHAWPGNVRELENTIERALILAADSLIDVEHLDLSGKNLPSRTLQDPTEDLSLEDYFARFVMENQDHMTETELARKLGISRKCLWERRHRLGIPRTKGQTG